MEYSMPISFISFGLTHVLLLWGLCQRGSGSLSLDNSWPESPLKSTFTGSTHLKGAVPWTGMWLRESQKQREELNLNPSAKKDKSFPLLSSWKNLEFDESVNLTQTDCHIFPEALMKNNISGSWGSFLSSPQRLHVFHDNSGLGTSGLGNFFKKLSSSIPSVG